MSTVSILLQCPTGMTSDPVYGATGATYTPNAAGYVTITDSNDVGPLIAAGFKIAKPYSGRASSTNGLTPTSLPLSNFRNITGAALAAAAAAGVFGYSITLATSMGLLSETANNNAKTDAAMFEFVVPDDYVAGQNLNVAVNTTITIGSGTLSVKTVQVKAYRTTAAGIQGADIGPGSATTIAANTATTTNFVITGTTVLPGDRLILEVIMALTETAASNVTATVNSVAVS